LDGGTVGCASVWELSMMVPFHLPSTCKTGDASFAFRPSRIFAFFGL